MSLGVERFSIDSQQQSRRDWHRTLALIAIVVLARLVYSIWLSPVQLAGDEAYYWQQARHLDLCYNEKGPALAWMMWPGLQLFGHHEWTVRLPVLISFAISAWAVGRITLAVAGNARAALYAVALFMLIPAFEANAELCTQDGPLIAIWLALTAVGLRLFRRWREGKNLWAEWSLFWATLAIGVLFKQSILLFGPSLIIFWFVYRRELPIRASFFAQQILGLVIFGALISPMIYWNSQHGWPMVSHTAGHLVASGDQANLVQKGNPLLWLGSTLGGIAGAFGPALLLMWWGSRAGWRDRDRFWLICAAVPSVLFFVLLSFIKPVIPSWPLPSLVPLVVIAGEYVARRAGTAHQLIAREDKVGSAHPTKAIWDIMIVYGVVAAILMGFPTLLAPIPKFRKTVLERVTGHREDANKIVKVIDEARQATGSDIVPVTRHYMHACLLSFYLPGHPMIRTAEKFLGKRPTTLDEWPDTRMDNPAIYGKNLLLVDESTIPWERALKFEKKLPTSRHHCWIAINYSGPQPNHPDLMSGSGEDE